jgi:hypothetical protein
MTGRLLNAHFIELTWVNSSGGDNVQNLCQVKGPIGKPMGP